MDANRQYKNSVFTSLFSTEARLRELYNAIAGTDYGEDVPVCINTLEDVFLSGAKNDVSFTIADKWVVLIEHQSTVNDNMPLRMLSYVANLYDQMVDKNALYHKRLISIPTPEFYVLYNGIDPYPDRTELRLSDAFTARRPDGNVPLELVVEVLNINHGRNADMVKKSKSLDGYAMLVAKTREYQAELEAAGEQKGTKKVLDKALRKAIQYCEAHGILPDFLQDHEQEAIMMKTLEFDIDTAIAVAREEARDEAREEAEQQYQQYQHQVQSLMEQIRNMGGTPAVA
jgi:hypothetical protein